MVVNKNNIIVTVSVTGKSGTSKGRILEIIASALRRSNYNVISKSKEDNKTYELYIVSWGE
jgi:nucleoside-triphosphatase THEP1